MTDEEFEEKLRLDLPRGRAGASERGMVANWLKPDRMIGEVWQHGQGGLLLGKRDGRLIGWKDDRHVMTIAGSRAGKGVSLIVPNLLLYEGSALVIDPKGENARITAGRRGLGTKAGGSGLGQDVHVLDPFGVTGMATASYNPLSELKPGSPDLIEDAGMFADALVTHPERGEKHWTELAQALLRALILIAAADPDPERRNLVTVRRLLQLTDDRIRDLQFEEAQKGNKLEAQEALIAIMKGQNDPRYGFICAGMAEQLKAMGDNERGSVLSEARTQTQWLDDARMRDVLWRSDFEIADLKRKKMTIYLCLPAMRMSTHARWFRLMILLALSVMERTKNKPPAPVLFVLDEFAVLEHIRSIEMAAGLMAGFGVKLWTIIQNAGQLKQYYDKAWETFFANSGVVTAFGLSDQETLRTLSDKLGRMRMAQRVDSGAVGSELLSGRPAFRDDYMDVPLLAEHELSRIFGREEKRMLVLGVGCPPAVVRRLEYFRDGMFEGLYDE